MARAKKPAFVPESTPSPTLAAAPAPDTSRVWESKIIDLQWMEVGELTNNPLNPRIHSLIQQQAMNGALNELGWIQTIVFNVNSGHVVDGHLRLMMAINKGETTVPVTRVNLTDEEERKALASFDPIGAMADTDSVKLMDLHDSISWEDPHVKAALDEVVKEHRAARDIGFLADLDKPTLRDGARDSEGGTTATMSPEDGSPVFFQMTFAFTSEQRRTLLNAIQLSRSVDNTGTSMEAIVLFAQRYIDAAPVVEVEGDVA